MHLAGRAETDEPRTGGQGIDAFIRFLGPRRRAASIMGVAEPALKLSVPLEVEVGIGKSWGEAH